VRVREISISRENTYGFDLLNAVLFRLGIENIEEGVKHVMDLHHELQENDMIYLNWSHGR